MATWMADAWSWTRKQFFIGFWLGEVGQNSAECGIYRTRGLGQMVELTMDITVVPL